MEDAKKLALYDVYVCVEKDCREKVRVKRSVRGRRGRTHRKCPKCGGLMAKTVVLGKK